MGNAVTATVVVATLFFSIACALLLEEFVFGGLFYLLRPLKKRAAQRHQEDDLVGNPEK